MRRRPVCLMHDTETRTCAWLGKRSPQWCPSTFHMLPPTPVRVAAVRLRQLVHLILLVLRRALILVRLHKLPREIVGKGMMRVVFTRAPLFVFLSGRLYDPTQRLALLLLRADAGGDELRPAPQPRFAEFERGLHGVQRLLQRHHRVVLLQLLRLGQLILEHDQHILDGGERLGLVSFLHDKVGQLRKHRRFFVKHSNLHGRQAPARILGRKHQFSARCW
mmetsp:Transcript_7774/g.19790  ORF Transcript_7774/g.19790 Transcript_7774/m.19790 type:complete len:220 (+) Transcript_7774:130-789(+)